MKLSEAIREGAKQGPQAFGVTFGPNGASCVLGSALLAIGAEGPYTRVFTHFDVALQTVDHPENWNTASVLTITRDLNDHYRWTREAIADWVEAVEAAGSAS